MALVVDALVRRVAAERVPGLPVLAVAVLVTGGEVEGVIKRVVAVGRMAERVACRVERVAGWWHREQQQRNQR